MSEKATASYRQIVKSSAWIGGSSVINVALGLVRTKVLALLIGPEGMGLFGAFSSVTTLISGIAGMGINSSGVREIAEAATAKDPERIALTAFTLRRTSLVLGMVGMLVLLAFCQPIARATFGDATHAIDFALLSVTILFATVAEGQSALIKGMRRIADVAAVSVWGAALGTLFSVPIIYLYREKGIVPFLVIVAALSIATSAWYARKVQVGRVAPSTSQVWSEAKALLGMGFVFMFSGMMASAVAYLSRVLIIREMGLQAAGLFQAAFALSGVYVGFVLGAMGADYFPRLTGVAHDNNEVNRLVNEQTEAALLMALPGILGTITFAPWAVNLLYSADFIPAVEILRWQILGVLGRVISWPMGYVLVAKGHSRLYFWTELFANAAHLGLVWIGMKWFGLRGLGMAFFGLYVLYVILMVIVVQKVSGFRWRKGALRLIFGSVLVTAFVFLASLGWGTGLWSMLVGGGLTVLVGLYAYNEIARRTGFSMVARIFRARR